MFLQVTGLEELRDAFADLSQREVANALRAAVHDVAKQMAVDIKAAAPVDSGDLKKSLKPKRRKAGKKGARSDVQSNKSKSAEGQPNAFYWKFIEYGTRKMPARPFIRPVKEAYAPRYPGIIREAVLKKVRQRLARRAARAQRMGAR